MLLKLPRANVLKNIDYMALTLLDRVGCEGRKYGEGLYLVLLSARLPSVSVGVIKK